MQPKTLITCSICQKKIAQSQGVPVTALRPALLDHLQKTHPEWVAEGFICHQDLVKYRSEQMRQILEGGKGKFSNLEADVARSLKDDELISRKLMEEPEGDYTFGQKMADGVARFGGSWSFLIAFAFFLMLWIALNVVIAVAYKKNTFDPYPFILLNLLLSCLASIQAPIIMMSQNRQEARDRKTAENDYKVNLKAELEIRDLRDKFEHLLDHQWQYLMEIQQIQVELMEDIASRTRPKLPIT